MKYAWILFDADETLFRFDTFAGLVRMFASLGVEFGAADFADYEAVNRALWSEYERGATTIAALGRRRFGEWSRRLGIDADWLNSAFLRAMAEISTTLPGAPSLLEALARVARLGIVTNGFSELQRVRLDRIGLARHFDVVVTSEDAGAAKPDPRIFAHAFAAMGQPQRAEVLMVGDSLQSDIRGGIAAGVDTCWLNRDGRPLPADLAPTFQVASLDELATRLLSPAQPEPRSDSCLT